MISLTISGCRIDILPIVQGLVSEADAVIENYGKYEVYAVPLSLENVEAVKRRKDLLNNYEVNELDIVYATKLSEFGEVQMPCPAYCEIIDLCQKDSVGLIPLDMSDSDFTETYVDNVKVLEFVSEHRLAKKGMKHAFDMSSPEAFARGWDGFINSVKGYRKISEHREKYIADRLIDVTRYRKNVLAVIEVERVDGILKHLENRS